MKTIVHTLALLAMLAPSVISAAEPDQAKPQQVATPTILPIEGSENPVNAGQLVTLTVDGLKDPTAGRIECWPTPELLRAVIDGTKDGEFERWSLEDAQILFRALAPGKYRVRGLVDSDGADVAVSYVVDVQGELPPDSLVVTPESPFRSKGPVGGPFDPIVQRYSVAASGKWTATISEGVGWASVSAGESSANVVITPGADDLAEGAYLATVTFACGGQTQKRDVQLLVGEDPGPTPDEKKQVAFYIESSDLDTMAPARREILTSRKFWDELEAAGHVVYETFEADDDPDNENEEAFFSVARSSGKQPPLLLLAPAEGGTIVAQPLPSSVQAVWDLLNGG